MNISALYYVILFAGVTLSIFGAIYRSAAQSQRKGELGSDAIHVLRLALMGNLCMYVLLGISALLSS